MGVVGWFVTLYMKHSKATGLHLINSINTSPFVRVKSAAIKNRIVAINRSIFMALVPISIIWIVEIVSSPFQAIYLESFFFPYVNQTKFKHLIIYDKNIFLL